MTIKEVAKDMGCSQQYLRLAIQQNRFPFATAIKMSSVWTYYISAERYALWKQGKI